MIMKKLYTILAIAILGFANAQVPNNGFEEILEDGFSLRSWGTFYVQTIIVGPEGTENTGSTLQFDNGIGFTMPVGDCITGSWAMQISNAFDTLNNLVIPGKASLINEAISPFATGWNNGLPLPEGSDVQFLGFDYKFFPMGNDVAVARLELFNDEVGSIGVAEITLTQQTSEFEYIYVPVQFTSLQTPTFMTIDFEMQKDGSEVNSWSTLIVDNVVVNSTMLGVRQNENNLFTVYPTLADSEINITANNVAGDVNVSIINIDGKKLQQQTLTLNGAAQSIDVSQLASGVYLLNTESNAGKSVTRFIKK
jgi:hypothetical protein